MNRFKPFKMATYSHSWPTKNVTNMHSSNPQPFSWHELEKLTGLDLHRVINQASLAYESIQGHEAVRKELVTQLYPSSHYNHISLVSGAQEGIFIAYNSLLSSGDEMITFKPCFEPLVAVAEATGANVKTLHLNKDENWSIPWEQLKSSLNNNTKVISINFPHNPTGACISQTELNRLIDLCENRGIWLFSDEVFKGLEHNKQQKLPAVAELYDRGISMGVMSKSLALPGIRLGWLATRDETLIQDWLNIKSHLSICQSSLDAHITAALLPYSDKLLKRNIDIITNNQKALIPLIAENPSFKFTPAQAAATVFIELMNHDSDSFCLELLKKKRLFVMPNSAFLTDTDGFRMTIGLSDAQHQYQTIFNDRH